MVYDSVCYKKSCLSQMIIRLDFMNFMDENIIFNEKIQEIIRRNFSRKGMQQIIKFHTMDLI